MISPITWLWNIRHRDLIEKARKIVMQEILDNSQKSGILKVTIRCVPSLKGEVPDVKKVKPSLTDSYVGEGFFIFK